MKDIKDILKNNILSVICGVVVILALVVPVWPMGGYKQELQTRLAERTGVFNSLNATRTKTRNLPIVDPDQANPTPLEGFPNENIIKKGDEVKTAFETQSKQLVDEAIKLNRHGVLVQGALPNAGNNAIAIEFRNRYRNLIISITNPNPNPNPAAPTPSTILGGIAQSMKVGVPPTQADIELARQKLWREKYQPQLGTVPGASINDRNKQMLQDEFNRESALVPDQERTRVAESSLIYMNLDALPFIQSFNNSQAPSAADLFNAQLNLWIIEDVRNAILESNAQSKNVTQAPVKHLVKIAVPYPQPFIVSPGQTLDGELTGPAPKVADLGQQNSPSPIAMPTGRVSNPLYDVVHFDLVVNVEAAQVPKFLSNLSHNRFLTVLTANVTAIDSAALKQQGFMYGDKPVVQLTLKCEDVFFHKWERELMPKAIADMMTGVQPNQPGGDGVPVY